MAPPQDENALQMVHHNAPAQDGTTATQRTPPQIEDISFMDAIQDELHVLPSPPRRNNIKSYQTNLLGCDFLVTSKGLKHASVQVKSSQHGSNQVKSYCVDIVSALMLCSDQSYYNRHLLNLLLKPDFGLSKNLGADALGKNPHAMKASMPHDPDTLHVHEAINGEH